MYPCPSPPVRPSGKNGLFSRQPPCTQLSIRVYHYEFNLTILNDVLIDIFYFLLIYNKVQWVSCLRMICVNHGGGR